MKKNFVTQDIALTLKEMGFNKECIAYYLNNGGFVAITQNKPHFITEINKNFEPHIEDCTAPLWEQVINWFEEKHQLVIIIEPYTAKYWTFKIYKISETIEIICLCGCDVNLDGDKTKRYDDKYTAIKEAILKAINILNETSTIG